MSCHTSPKLTAFLFVFMSACCTNAAVIVQTSGGNDPANAGFVLDGKATYSASNGNDGEDYWYTRGTRIVFYLYAANVSDFQDINGWTATCRTKVIPTNTADFTDNFFAVRNGARRFDLSIFGGSGTNTAGVYVLLRTGYVRIDSPVVDVTKYHTYQISYNPDTKAASYYADGILLATYAEDAMYTTTSAELMWGDQYSKVTGLYENRYSLVRFETGRNIIPELGNISYWLSGVPY